MVITALVDNSKLESRKDLRAEHGLALRIQRNGLQILYDTGETEAFSENAEKMGIDIREVEAVVISHHHFDHGGGLATFLEANQKAKIYLRRAEERDFYFKAFGFINKYVGLDRDLFEKYPGRFEFVEKDTEILPNVFILTQIEKPYPLPKGNRHLFARKGDTCELDSFDHELILVLQEEGRLVVFTGCSHNGILNMIDTVVKQFPGIPIKAVFGGFHLIDLPIFNTMAGSKKEVAGIAEELLKYPIDKLYTGHCTGMKAYRVLKGVLGEKLEHFPTGSIAEL